MKCRFEVGEQVEVIGVESGWDDGVGKIGTVIGAWSRNVYYVEFPERYYRLLHNCDGHAKSGNGWNFQAHNIRRAEIPVDVDFDELL